MSIFEYDEEDVKKLWKKEFYEEGLEIGKAEGMEAGKAEGLKQGKEEGLSEGKIMGGLQEIELA